MAKDLCRLESEPARDPLRTASFAIDRLLDEQTYRLHSQFIRSHGLSSGEVTRMHARNDAIVHSSMQPYRG